MAKKKKKKTPRSVRFGFSSDADYEAFRIAYDRLQTAALIQGESPPDVILRLFRDYNDNQRALLESATWLGRDDLIERLEKDFGIATNAMTLHNYRKAGRLDGLFGTDGKNIVWNLEATAARYNELKTAKNKNGKKIY